MTKDLSVELKRIGKLEFENNNFNNRPFYFSDFPNFQSYLNSLLESEDLQLPSLEHDVHANSAIGRGKFDLQRHTASVAEHRDDVPPGIFYGLYVLNARDMPYMNQFHRRLKYFDTRNEFWYYDLDGKKQKERIKPGELYVFNPRRDHQLIFYGDYSTLVLFDVIKSKRQ